MTNLDKMALLERLPTIEERVETLEEVVKNTSEKMDRICSLLEELVKPVRRAKILRRKEIEYLQIEYEKEKMISYSYETERAKKLRRRFEILTREEQIEHIVYKG
jgi:hypothetical protein